MQSKGVPFYSIVSYSELLLPAYEYFHTHCDKADTYYTQLICQRVLYKNSCLIVLCEVHYLLKSIVLTMYSSLAIHMFDNSSP